MWWEHQWHIRLRLVCHFFVLSTFWRHLWSLLNRRTATRNLFVKCKFTAQIFWTCCLSSFCHHTAVSCGALSSPTNGLIQRQSGTTFKSVYVFRCKKAQGYIMKGSAERKCLANATWSGEQPICYSKWLKQCTLWWLCILTTATAKVVFHNDLLSSPFSLWKKLNRKQLR